MQRAVDCYGLDLQHVDGVAGMFAGKLAGEAWFRSDGAAAVDVVVVGRGN